MRHVLLPDNIYKMSVEQIESALSELKEEVRAEHDSGEGNAAPELRALIDIFESLRTEISLNLPNVNALSSLMNEAKAQHANILRRMIDAMNNGRVPTEFGGSDGAKKIKAVFDALTAEIVQIANRRTVEFNQIAAAANPTATVDNRSTLSQDAPMSDLNRQELEAKLAQNKAEVDARLANFDTSIKTGFADLRAEFAALRTEIADGRTDAAKQNHDSMKWIIGTVITMVSISVAIIGLFINLSKSDKPAAQPGAIVITVPGATVGPAPAPAASPSAK